MPIDQVRFLFVTGKGGVGKSTVCAAFAGLLRARGQRVLVATSDPKERLSTLLGVEPLGPDMQQLGPGLWGVNIQPQHALKEYGLQVFKTGLMHRAVFGNRYVQNFFAAVPGLYQWAILGKAWFHSTETEPDQSPRFHTVIFDAPATGHALEMLWVPKIITRVASSGRLYRDAARAFAMLQDPNHSAFCVVSLPEETPTLETEELVGMLRGELGLPVQCVVQNATLKPLLTANERAGLLRLTVPLSAPTLALRRRAEEETTGERCSQRLERLSPDCCLSLPRLFEGAASPGAIQRLTDSLARALSHG